MLGIQQIEESGTCQIYGQYPRTVTVVDEQFVSRLYIR